MSSSRRKWPLYGLLAGVAWGGLILGWIAVQVFLKARAGVAAGEAMAWGIGATLVSSLPLSFPLAELADRMGDTGPLFGVVYVLLFLSIFINWGAVGALTGWLLSFIPKRTGAST